MDAWEFGSVLISIHAPHARSDRLTDENQSFRSISIHAPHARSDTTRKISNVVSINISIHAPHARSDGATACTGS